MINNPANSIPKAIALISGGLDSMLAAKVMLDQGVHVEGINFYTGFCVEGHTHSIRNKPRNRPQRNNALWVAKQLGIKLHIIEVIEEYKKVVTQPKYGYGSNLNPCLDCKSFMIRKAHEWIQQHGFDFIVTGEVIGQRPKSQKKKFIPIIARESGAYELIVRPLSARLLPPTLPENQGWIDRDRLFDFSGRSRKPQIAMAEQYGFHDYAQPAGGCCFLTDENYSRKLRDLWKHRNSRDYELDDIMLLKIGRHIRPNEHFKLIIGRDEGENNFLSGYRKQFISLNPVSHLGPLALIDGIPDKNDISLAARLLARYSQGRSARQVEVSITLPAHGTTNLMVEPLPTGDIHNSWYI